MFEYAWSRNFRFRQIDEARDRNYPLFRRYDNKNWSRWKFYPGAVLWMPTRFFGLIIIAIVFNLIASLMTCGHDFSKGPIKKGCKKTCIRGIYRSMSALYVFTAGLWTSNEIRQCDYSYYLGPNYQQSYKHI